MIDLKEHFQKLQSLLEIEREEDRRQYLLKIQNRVLEDRRKDGVTWYPLLIRKSYIGIGDKWMLEVERKANVGERHHFHAGSSASIFLNDSDKSISGIINRVREDSILLMLNKNEPPEWIEDGKIGIDLLFDESTYDEMDRTLKKMSNLKDDRRKYLTQVLLRNVDPYFKKTHVISYPDLNDSQSSAIDKIRSAKDIALIHGPPGTGKTTTLVQAIMETVSDEKQVLVCAPSNAAVDLIVEKLHQKEVSVTRLGHPARVTDEVVSHTLDVQMLEHRDGKTLKGLHKKSEELRKLGRKYKRNFGRAEMNQRKLLLDESKKLKEEAHYMEDYITQDILDNSSVIACTLIGANGQNLYGRHFKTVFIDESSQALEPAAWIPVLKADRVIMTGDHLQLPPTIKSKEAEKAGLGHTLFERNIPNSDASSVLKTQYRMRPEIMSFSNSEFYGNELKTDESVLNRPKLFEKAMMFVDTAGCGYQEKKNPETLSTFNEEEASFVFRHLREMLAAQKASISVGVIAPYKAQIGQLNSRYDDYEWSEETNISINTVDAFQGQERDVIYISLTRSNESGEIGFLANERRMNVAMTRAKHLLVMVGDSSTLSSNSYFDRLIQFCQEGDFYHSAFEYLYTDS